MAGNSNFKELVEFKSNYPEFSQQCRTRHFVKFRDFNFANYDIFAGKMTSQILLLVLWDILCQFLMTLLHRSQN